MTGNRKSLFPPLPRGGVHLRFWVEPLGKHTQHQPGHEPRQIGHGRQDLVDCLPGFRWALILPEAGEIIGFHTITGFKAHCLDRFGVTHWKRDWTGDWTPQDGDSWKSNEGELWPGRVAV